MSGKRLTTAAGFLALLIGSTGCFVEDLPEQDLFGEVVLPQGLVEDPRYAGVIYLGVYEGFDPQQLGYPYPTTGPRVGDNPIGDALPYGGTTVGHYSYGCYRVLRCAVLSGRYESLEALLEVNPVEEEDGELVTAEDMYDHCSWYYGWNHLGEFTFVGDDQLDFSQDENGDWVAPFTAYHGRLPAGAVIWGFADNDSTSCSIDQGILNRKRSEDGAYYREGSNYSDVLNFPDKYITTGDFISQEVTVIEDGKTEGYRLVLDYTKE